MSTTPRLVPLRRMHIVQPPADQPTHRDPLHGAVQAACTAATFRASLDHTESAAMAFDAEEPRPKLGRDYAQGHAHGYIDGLRACGTRMPGSALFVVGVMFGAACALLWTVFA